MKAKRDIFDRIMSCKMLGFAEPFYTAHKEVLLYLFFGALTTVVSVVSFTASYKLVGLNEHFANIISWCLAVLFAFVTNRTWVFKGSVNSNGGLLKQILSFYCGRLFSLAVEEVIIFLFVSKLGCGAVLIKIISQVVVIVLNYFISKFLVFGSASKDCG